MKNTNRTLGSYATSQFLIEVGILFVVLAMIALLASCISDAAFWNHTTLNQ